MLVPFRDSGARSRLWDFVRHRLEREHPDFEIVVASDDGQDPFHKTLALNKAAAVASGDVFYVTDSDTWAPPAHVEAAVAGIMRDPSRWWRPWTRKCKLGAKLTEQVLRLGDDWDGTVDLTWRARNSLESRNTWWSSPPLMIHRDMWNEVGGFDERFRGWGNEDDAFAFSLRALFGEGEAVLGNCVHLFHDRVRRSGDDLWPGQESKVANLALVAEYKAARTPDAMRELIRTRNKGALL